MKRAKARSRGIWPRHDAKVQFGRQIVKFKVLCAGDIVDVLGSFTNV
jgi:hypothetical protein